MSTQLPDYFEPIDSESLPDYFEAEQPEESKIGRVAKQSGITALTNVSGLLGDIGGAVKGLALSSIPEDKRKYFEPLFGSAGHAPGRQKLREKFYEAVPSLTPREGEEDIQEGVDLFIDLVGPAKGTSLLKMATRAGIGTAAGLTSKQLLKASGFDEDSQEMGKYITSLIPMIAKGKINVKGEEAKKLYEAGKKAGLTDVELSPLLASERRLKLAGKVGKPSDKIHQALESVETKLGDRYGSIKEQSKNLPPLGLSQATNLTDDFSKVIKNIGGEIAKSPDEKAAISFIEEAIEGINNKVITPSDLISFWQSINRSVNWNSISGGKKQLQALKEPILQALKSSSPELADEFVLTNKLYENFKKSEKILTPKDYEKIIDGLLTGGNIGGLLYALGTGDASYFKKALAAKIGAAGARRFVSNLALNPKYQSIAKNSLKALASDNKKATATVLSQLKKEDPEAYVALLDELESEED